MIPFFYDLSQDQQNDMRPDYIISLCNRSFCDNKYDTEDILLVENRFVEVDSSLSDIICQYYLSLTYSDILKNGVDDKYQQETISVFSTYAKAVGNLQMHHIMPIGSLDAKYNAADKINRANRSCKYNSPLNMIFISDKANRLISNNTLSNYVKYCDTNVLCKVGIDASFDESLISADTDVHVENMLKKRFKALCSSLKSHYAKCLAIEETDIENFYEKAQQIS